MILLIDNYDSFSYNLYQLIGSINPDIRVIRNDAMAVSAIRALAPEAIILFGGLTKSGHWIMDPIVEAMNANVLPIWKNKVKVLVSTLKDSDAAILGASSLAWDVEAQAPMRS